MINKDRLFRTFSELVSIDSLSFHEREFADRLRRRLTELGFEVTEDDSTGITGSDAGNIYAYMPPDLPAGVSADSVLLSAHMDTVAPGKGKKAVLHDDGRITSGGDAVLGADDAGGIAEILEAVEEILEEGVPHRGIELFFPVAEEVYCAGSYAFDTKRIKSSRAYFLDRTGDVGSATICEPTLISYVTEIHGRASHAGFDPEKGINAIAVAAQAISELPIGRVDPDTTLAVGVIYGGTATNIVPDQAVVKGEIRSRVHDKAVETLRAVGSAFENAADKAGGTVDIKHTQHLEAYSVPEDSPALNAYIDTLKKLDIPYKPEVSFGGSDANAFRARGLDAVCIANAMWDIHTVSEYSDINEMAKVCDILKEMVRQ